MGLSMYSHYFPPTTEGQVVAPLKHALSFQVHFQHVSGLANSELQIDTCLQPRSMSVKIPEIYLPCPGSAGPYELPELYSVADHACGCINFIESKVRIGNLSNVNLEPAVIEYEEGLKKKISEKATKLQKEIEEIM